jgi:hypothetical protein
MSRPLFFDKKQNLFINNPRLAARKAFFADQTNRVSHPITTFAVSKIPLPHRERRFSHPLNRQHPVIARPPHSGRRNTEKKSRTSRPGLSKRFILFSIKLKS